MVWYSHFFQNYSSIKNEILLFTTTGMNLEGIMVSEVSQTKRNTACYHLYYDISSKINEHNSGNRLTDIKN